MAGMQRDDDLQPALHEEIARLPARYRLPIVLCYLEGRTHFQAAAELKCGEATLRRRLACARERLRVRLAQRGFAPISVVLGGSLAAQANATVSAAFMQATINAVTRITAGETMATVVSARVLSLAGGGSSVWRFKSQAMATLRSVEPQYWNLVQTHVQLGGAERAVALAAEILDHEQAELKVGRGTAAGVGKAAQRLEQFNLDLVTRTSDVLTTERELRKKLGLPPADNRRIVPVTLPTEALLEPDWDTCLAEMMTHQPEIVLKKLALAEVPALGAPRSGEYEARTIKCQE